MKKIRLTIGKWLLNRKITKVHRAVSAIGLQQIKSAAIIFEANKEENLKYVKNLIKFLPINTLVNVVGFISGKRRNYSYIGDKVYNYINEEDFDFFMQPKTESIKDLINKQFDILFVLAYDYHFPIDLISGLSKASFKVGQSGVYEKNLDLFIETNKKDINYLISQITHYLS